MTDLLDQLVQNLIDIGLMTADEVREFLDSIPSAIRPSDHEALARCLVADGKLTPYQATALRDGKAEELVFGNYVVLDRLGEGGMGAVFKARHRRMKRVVAIKVLPRAMIDSVERLQRFQREVEAVARLSHPNIVTAYDADEAKAGPFLVMEYVEGSDLADLVQKHGPLPVRQAVDCTLQAARALAYAHGQGIIHRDVKPANLLLDSKGTIKVADLGLARIETSRADDGLTKTGTIFGTVDFLSPEQALNSRAADHRSDIYSLGCCLYYLLTGQLTYRGESIMEKLLAHRERPIPRLRQIRPEIPEPLEAVFRRMVSKKIEERWQSMNEVIGALEGCDVTDASLTARPVGPKRPSDWIAPTDPYRPSDSTLLEVDIVLVEPSRTQSLVISSQLQKLGIRRVVRSVEGAVALQTMLAAPPDLVISAMHLPDMTAADLAAKVRAEDRLQEVAFLLISSEDDLKQLGSGAPIAGLSLLRKPFTLEQLKQAVWSAVTPPAAKGPPAREHDIAQARVLIVDDSFAARGQVRRVLADLGVKHVGEATNGKQAVKLLETGVFDLVVTDYSMPEMEGPDLVRHIRQHRTLRAVPVLMITSESDEAKLTAARQAGVSVLCSKSSDPDTIRRTVESMLRGKIP